MDKGVAAGILPHSLLQSLDSRLFPSNQYSLQNLKAPCGSLCVANGRTVQFGEGWHSSENTVRFWTPSPRVPKEADIRCYAFTTAYATMMQLCNVFCARSKTPTPSPT